MIKDDAPLETQYVFGIGMVLWLPEKTLERLAWKNLIAILAHEMYHIKKHNFLFSILCELSEWTLFGKGFLVFSLNTHKIEYEADAFAVKYLETNNLSKDSLIEGLDIISLEFAKRKNNLNKGGLHFSLIKPKQKNENITFLEKLNIFLGFYYGDEILTYLHPSINQRKEKIKAL